MLAVTRLGCVPYEQAWALQDALVRARTADAAPDTLLLLQHPHTYTLGSAGDEAHLLMGADERARRGISVLRVDRGGDVTYHGPGQLVGYPILRLARVDVRAYISRLEQVLIDTLAAFGMTGEREPGLRGVWVGGAKVAAVGVKINTAGVTKHGFALNINTDLRYFDGIVPCGLARPVTSMAALLGAPVNLEAVGDALERQWRRHFDGVPPPLG